jgi:hypothetical protein
MSLVQAASRCDGSSFQTTMEAIELGFQKNPPIYNDSQTHVFMPFNPLVSVLWPPVEALYELILTLAGLS